MAAATVTTRPDKLRLAQEHVVLTLSDGETFESSLGTVIGCHITHAEDMGAETNSPSYSVSGSTITFYADGVTDKKTFVTVYGYK